MTIPKQIPSAAKHLKAQTHDAHDALDQRIMASAPFSSTIRYAQFLRAQRRFHATIDPLFGEPRLQSIVPQLAERRRLAEIDLDLGDLGIESQTDRSSVVVDFTSPATAWGWFYVAEGSKLGAAILLKHAQRLGLSEAFGARHLAAHDDGRARHWRSFVEAMDQVAWTNAELAVMVEGATHAFSTMKAFVEQEMPLFDRRSERSLVD
ncbi:heme oxygenase [Xanthomonas arboricola]|uniref:biliverdin-producing heme oxygenase n=1 Tax=Xanthomonas euroxanthea TaxID=2259622 RepID=UPI00141A88D8|nr:biliverdin-producing heme oxygenase [Xanthomonas euroxanthea]NIK07432.1 heme oxygenase [Xanthomonas euroxanthea]